MYNWFEKLLCWVGRHWGDPTSPYGWYLLGGLIEIAEFEDYEEDFGEGFEYVHFYLVFRNTTLYHRWWFL